LAAEKITKKASQGRKRIPAEGGSNTSASRYNHIRQ
jgi:hypothetical protein